MKKIFIIYLLIICVFSLVPDELDKYNDQLNSILNTMEKIVKKNNEKNILERINFIKNKINNFELIFKIDDSVEKNIFTGIGFAAPEKNNEKPYIYFYKEIFDLYKKQPSIVMSALIHEFQHAYDYYNNNRLYMISFKNVLERYFFEMDAYHIEALFINKILKKEKYYLSNFEKLLSDSFTNDNLNYFSIVFKGINMHQIYYYSNYANENELDNTIKLFEEEGENILKNYNILNNDDDWIKYQKIVPLFTYFYFIPQLTLDIEYNKTNGKLDHKTFKLEKSYPKLYKIWNNIKDEYFKQEEVFNNYYDNINNKFKM